MVSVRLGRAVEIDPDGAEPVTWAFHRLRTAVPLDRRSKDVLLGSIDHPGASLFVADPAFVHAILARSAHLSTGSVRWRHARPWLAVAAVVALIAFSIWALDLSPARTIAGMLPHDAREAIGRQALQSFTAGYDKCTGPAGLAALERLQQTLQDAAGPGSKFEMQVVDWGMVNAFALPGEQIVLLRGLIEEADSPDEVAGVIAHEMGHGLELHPETGIVRAIGISAAVMLMFGDSSTIGNWGAHLLQLSYTRDAEREADAHALRILKGAEISPKGISDFFKRLDPGSTTTGEKTAEGASSLSTNIFSTHPESAERAKAAEAAAATYQGRPALSDADWTALRTICGE
jgi:predicted Zn-dependent protease